MALEAKPNTGRWTVKTFPMGSGTQILFRLCLAFLAVLAACSDPASSPTTGPRLPTADAPATTEPVASTAPPITTSTTSLPPAPPPMVSPDPDQEGVAAPLWDDTGYGEEPYAQLLVEIAELGAEWVSIVPTWYQDSPTDSDLYPEASGRTTTDEALVTAMRNARELGLSVMLKPHVDLVDGGSRLDIAPEDEAAWFKAYEEMILHYASIAAAEHADQFVVGTELAGTLHAEEEWRRIIGEVRAVYDGPLTYAANHDSYEDVPFWDALDLIGIDAYFPLADEPTTDVNRLTESWEAIGKRIGDLAARLGRQVVLTEVGYPSQQGAVTRPFDPHVSSAVSVEEQDAALRAMLGALDDESWFAGFHWWMWFDERTAEQQELGYTPKGKPAGDTLRERWSGRTDAAASDPVR